MRGTWQTTDSSGGGSIVLAIIVVIIFGAAASAGAAVHAAEHALDLLLHVVLITVAVIAGLGVTGLGLLALRARRTPRTPPWTAQVVQTPASAPQRVVEAPAAAHSILPPQIHLHLHGPVSAADVAELIARQGNPQPAIEEDS